MRSFRKVALRKNRVFVWGVVLASCLGMQLHCVWGQSANISEQYLLVAANEDRIAHRLEPVRVDSSLNAAALFHAREMALRRTISHRFLGEPDLPARAADAGAQFSLVMENVAEASNSALIHELWMKSAGHRANLLDPEIDAVGIAVVAEHGQLYAVEDFARMVKQLEIPAQEADVAKLVEAAGVDVLGDPQNARKTCGLPSGYAGKEKPWFVVRYTTVNLSQLPDVLREKLVSGKYRQAAVGACLNSRRRAFSSYSIAVMLYP